MNPRHVRQHQIVRMEQFDVVVVGAGPTGLSCGIECERSDLSFAVFDKGCVVQSIADYPVEMTFFTTPELLEIGDIPMTSLREKPTRIEALKYYRKVADYCRLHVHQYEPVTQIEGADGDFLARTVTLHGEERQYRARKVVLATGYYGQPNLLGVPGEELPKVSHYYREAHPYHDTNVAVIGGRNSAAIATLELYRSGARVTLIHHGPRLSDSIKYWIRPDLENRIKNGEVRALFSSRVTEIRDKCIRVETPAGDEWLDNDFVLAMTGYHPDFAFLRSVGITIDAVSGRPVCDPETYQSQVAGVYLAGVLVAGVHTNEIFIENGRFHGKRIVADIARRLGPRAA